MSEDIWHMVYLPVRGQGDSHRWFRSSVFPGLVISEPPKTNTGVDYMLKLGQYASWSLPIVKHRSGTIICVRR